MAITKTQMVINALKRLECTEVESPNRYRIFEAKEGTFLRLMYRYWLVGRSGGLRANKTKAASGSRSFTHRIPSILKRSLEK